jgi:uncharacterized damage-inducible protein DinB
MELVNVAAFNQHLLEAVLDSWDRNNTILIGFLRALPEGGLEARALLGSWSVAVQLAHIHHTRQFYVSQAVPELAKDLPELFQRKGEDLIAERSLERIVEALEASARAVSQAVKRGVETNQAFRGTEIAYDHPVLLLQHMLWHEGYHIGQMMLARKATQQPMSDEEAARVMWSHWQRNVEPH